MDNKGAEVPPAYPERQQQPQGQYPQQGYYPQQQGQYPQQQGQYPQQQGQYTGQQQQYVMQPVAPIVLNQPPVQHDFTFPKGRAPSIILLVCAVANLICYIVVGAMDGVWLGTAWLPGFIFYGIAGVLGGIGSLTIQRHQGVAIATIVMSTFSMIVGFSETIIELTIVTWIEITYSWPYLVMLLFGLAAFGCSIALMVITSQVACDCCRPRQQ